MNFIIFSFLLQLSVRLIYNYLGDIMLIDLNELSIKDEIKINYDVYKDDLIDKRILDLKNAKVVGRVYLNSLSVFELECKFFGTMYLEDSISLESIPYDFNIEISENIEEIQENYNDVYDFSKNTLDLKQILWQNIVLEVPISYSLTDQHEQLKGDGWELRDNDSKKIDSRLAVLNELLEEGKE